MKNRLCSLLLLFFAAISPLAAQNDIDETTARLEMARVLRDSGRQEEAITAYRQLLVAAPSNREAQSELAEVLVWNKQVEEARKVLESMPEKEWTPSAFSAAADMDTQAGRFDSAEKRLRRLLDEKASDDIRVRLASVLSWQKKYDESITLFSGLVENHPTDVQLRRKYAQVLGWAGKPEAAAEQWRISLEPAP